MHSDSIIHLLDENTINQIAAGEVIENTASIIKELTENSIDAHAKSITIEILSGGRQNLKITDDGAGMSFDDVRLSLQRHATSKIKKAEDLSHIHTMGFRGEALSSIASVSKVKIFSKLKSASSGTHLYAEGGEILEHKNIDCHEGTKIEVSSLFFNAPVRRKFLKSIDTDIANCVKTVTEIALAHPEVSLTLISNQKILIKAHSGTLENRIKDVLGNDFLENMHQIQYQDDSIKIEGFLSEPRKTRPNRSGQYILLNNRFVSCPAICYAVMDAYATLLEPRRFPLFVLKIDIDPTLIDINVHPQKKEVRLRKESYLRTIITRCVEKTFNKTFNENTPLPWQEPEFPKTFFYNSKEDSDFNSLQEPKCLKEQFSINLSAYNFSPQNYKNENKQLQPNQIQSDNQIELIPQAFEQKTLQLNMKSCQLVGVWQSYILLEKNSDLFFIDPKRLASRIYYEEYKNKGGDQEPMQQLLIPLNFTFSPTESKFIEQKKASFQKMGIELRTFGPNTFIVEAHSLKLDEQIIKTMIENFIKNDDDESLFKEFSYQRSLKINQPNLYESEVLIKMWEDLGCPQLCPKGNYIGWKLPKEKIFS